MEGSIRMAEDRDKWRKYVHCVANSRIEEAEGQNKKLIILLISWCVCCEYLLSVNELR